MNRQTDSCCWMTSVYAASQRKSPMRIIVHIGHLRIPFGAANWVLYVTPYPAFSPAFAEFYPTRVSCLTPCPCGFHWDLPFYPIRFLTGNPARRCVVFLFLACSLKLKSWQASPKKYLIGRSFTFTPDAYAPGVQQKAYKWYPISFEKACYDDTVRKQ